MKQGTQSVALPHHVTTEKSDETQDTFLSTKTPKETERGQTDRQIIVYPLLTEICISSA